MQINLHSTCIWIMALALLSSCAGTRNTTRKHPKTDSTLTIAQPIDTSGIISIADTTSRDTLKVEVTKPQPNKPTGRWHTFQTPNAMVSLTMGKQDMNVKCQVQAVWDSILIVSVSPVLGIELLRAEVTPNNLLLVDKMHKRYSLVTYEEANQLIVPAISYNDLQDICTGAIPINATNGQIAYRANGQNVRLSVKCSQSKIDAPLHIQRMTMQSYTQVNLKTLLK